MTITKPDAEAARLRRRRSVKEDIARLDVIRDKVREKDAVIAAVGRDRDTAVAIHQEKCQPIQAELATLEAAQVSAIVDRLHANPAHEVRRRELLADLEAANVELETVTTATATRLQRLNTEREGLRIQLQEETTLNNKLFGHDLADPELRPRWESSKVAIQYAMARHTAAREQVATNKERISDTLHNWRTAAEGSLEAYRARLRDWEVELEEARAWLEEAKVREAGLREQLINE